MVTQWSTVVSDDDKVSSSVYSRHRAQSRTEQSKAGIICDRMTTEYKHDEYCNRLLTLGACNSFAGPNGREFALHYAGRHHPDVNVFQTLQQRLHGIRKCDINCTCKRRSPTDGTDTSQWSCHICSCGKKEWRSWRERAGVFIMPHRGSSICCLTINGIHITCRGRRIFCQIIVLQNHFIVRRRRPSV